MSNKQLEYDCIERIKNASNGFNRRKKEIVDILFSEDIVRTENERPDFLKKCIIDGEEVIVGVEHFSVDQFSKLTRKKNSSTSKLQGSSFSMSKSISETFNNYQNAVWTDEKYRSAAEDLANIIANEYTNKENFTYQIFIDTFRSHLLTHLEKYEDYLRNIESVNHENLKVKMCYLIDFIIDFDSYFFVRNKKLRPCDDYFIPLFEEFVAELEKLYNCGVEYVILSFSNLLKNKAKVIPLETKNIREQLKKYNILIYYYVGQDMFLNEFNRLKKNLKTTFELTDFPDRIDVNYQYEYQPLNDSQAKQMVLFACAIAYYYKQGGLNFVIDTQVAMFLFVFYDMISGWYINDDPVAVIMPRIKHFNIDLINSREKQFKDYFLNGESKD